MNKDIIVLRDELINELSKMSVSSLREYREELLHMLQSEQAPELTKFYLTNLIDLVIRKKQERAGAAI